jgi:hypothetical protein
MVVQALAAMARLKGTEKKAPCLKGALITSGETVPGK